VEEAAAIKQANVKAGNTGTLQPYIIGLFDNNEDRREAC
jgi:hypothetical protein